MKDLVMGNAGRKRRFLTCLLAAALLLAVTSMSVSLSGSVHVAHAAARPARLPGPGVGSTFTFPLVPSNQNISQCLPRARGIVSIFKEAQNDAMEIRVFGLAPNTGYDFFVTQVPRPPFGTSWYQSDLQTDRFGNGRVRVQGIFNQETFTLVNGVPVNMYHLGLWFNNPFVPFLLGCEPGATSPIITPFNGEHNAGIQVLNTGTFPDNFGPLYFVQP